MSSGQYLTTYVISGNISATPDGEGMFWLLSQPAPWPEVYVVLIIESIYFFTVWKFFLQTAKILSQISSLLQHLYFYIFYALFINSLVVVSSKC